MASTGGEQSHAMNRASVSQAPRPPREARTARREAVNAREAGLDLIRRVNRWLIAAAVAAAGFLSLLAANAFHGRTITTSGGSASSAAQSQSQSSPSVSGSSTSSSSAGGSGLQSPAQAPAPAPAAPAPVVSGGS
jgi:hypothetical protein